MEQTIFRAGNSNVLAIPSTLAKKIGFSVGTKVIVEATPVGDALLVRHARPEVKTRKRAVSKEFEKWLQVVLEEDKEILDELAKR